MSNGIGLDPGKLASVTVTITSPTTARKLALFSDQNLTASVTNPFTLTALAKVWVGEDVPGAQISMVSGGIERATVDGVPLSYNFSAGEISTVKAYDGPVTDTIANGTYRPSSYPADVTPRTKGYDSRTAVYNLATAGLRSAQAVLAQAVAGAAYLDILCVGDSTTWGFAGNAADPSVVSMPVQMAGLLSRFGIPDGGTGWVFTNKQTGNTDSRWVFSAGWVSGGGGRNYLQTSTSGATATFTSDHAGTVVEFAYFTNGAPFTYSIDGAAPVTVTPSGPAALATIAITGLANTTHTLLLTTTTTSPAQAICARVRQTTGIAVTNAGISGSSTVDWAPAGAYNTAFSVVTANPGLAAVTTYGATFLSFGINDALIPLTPATFQANLQAIASACPGSVILWVPPTPNTGNISAATWLPFRQAYYNVADALNLPLVDIGDAAGPYTTANANGLRFDGYHPSAAGYAHIASFLSSLLVPFGNQPGDRKWTVAALVNGWVQFGNGFSQVSFRKDANGFVHLRGLASGGTVTAGTTMFTLPVGYRPAASMSVPVVGGGAFGEVRLSSAGAVAAQTVSASFTSFDGITFLAEN